MSKIVTLKEGDTEIYPVTSVEAIFDKVKIGNIQDSAIISYGVLKVRIWGFNYGRKTK